MTAQTWIMIGTVLAAAASLGAFAFALIRVGANSARNAGEVAKAIEHLTQALGDIKSRFEAYVVAERNRDESLEEWRRAVEAQLSALKVGVEGMSNTLTLLVQSSVRGRRGSGVAT